jgi:methylated-DNA-[protein]-cysteine S-methyltransferase
MSISTKPAAGAAATTTMDSPLGEIVIVVRAGAVREIRLPDAAVELPREWTVRRESAEPGECADVDAPPSAADVVLVETRRQLAEYFAGRRREFDVPLVLRGTAFQERVWQALLGVRYGETVSYTELARAVGAPTAARAVGAAVGRNPLPIVVPCHRVIGLAGDLRGFASGLARKRWLLLAETADGRR